MFLDLPKSVYHKHVQPVLTLLGLLLGLLLECQAPQVLVKRLLSAAPTLDHPRSILDDQKLQR